MKRGFRTSLALFLLTIILMLPSCGMLENYGLDDDIEAKATEMMKCVQKKDSKGLVSLYGSEMNANLKTPSKAELETKKMLDFIDGNISSYEYKGKGSVEKTMSGNDISYFECNPEFSFETSNEKSYTITFNYLHICTADNDKTGIMGYTIRETGQKTNTFKSLNKKSMF